jgi:hypothetical protein
LESSTGQASTSRNQQSFHSDSSKWRGLILHVSANQCCCVRDNSSTPSSISLKKATFILYSLPVLSIEGTIQQCLVLLKCTKTSSCLSLQVSRKIAMTWVVQATSSALGFSWGSIPTGLSWLSESLPCIVLVKNHLKLTNNHTRIIEKGKHQLTNLDDRKLSFALLQNFRSLCT